MDLPVCTVRLLLIGIYDAGQPRERKDCLFLDNS